MNMMYYEIYYSDFHGGYEIWKWTGNGQHSERIKFLKTKKAAENWAAKQWYKVIWR